MNPKMPRKLLVEAVVSALSVSPKALKRRSLMAVVGAIEQNLILRWLGSLYLQLLSNPIPKLLFRLRFAQFLTIPKKLIQSLLA